MGGQVLNMRGVAIRRDGAVLVRDIDWAVAEDERWVVIGPNGAGKTTLLQIAAALLFPTDGAVDILGERLGQTDVFELRPASAWPARRWPRRSRRRRRSSTSSSPPPTPSSAAGPRNTTPRRHPGRRADRPARLRPPHPPPVRHPVRRRAQARPDRPRPHARPRAAAARRAGRRASTSPPAKTSSAVCPSSPRTPKRPRWCS